MDVNHLDSRVAPYYDADTCFRFALVAGPVEFIFDTGVCCDELAAGGMVRSSWTQQIDRPALSISRTTEYILPPSVLDLAPVLMLIVPIAH